MSIRAVALKTSSKLHEFSNSSKDAIPSKISRQMGNSSLISLWRFFSNLASDPAFLAEYSMLFQ
jgi:hypothetical protein